MNIGKYVFSQLISLLSHNEFNRCVNRYNGNSRVKKFSCWHQLLCLIFGQLTHRESLRDIVTCLNSQKSKLYHLGLPKQIARSTFADANERRDWRIYADLAQTLMHEARMLYPSQTTRNGIDHTIFALDASLIRICISVFPWADYRTTTAGVKIHTLLEVENSIPQFFAISKGKVNDVLILKDLLFIPGAFYVMDRGYWDLAQLHRIELNKSFFLIRAKKTLKFRRMYSIPRKDYPNIQADQIGQFSVPSSYKLYPAKVRRIRARDPETNKKIVLVTNNMHLSSREIANIYRKRWEVELFFKWIKQHLKIKCFWGTSENAVLTQIWTALISYLLVAIAKKRLRIEQNLYQILQVLSVSIFDKDPVNQLFIKNTLQKQPTDFYNQLKIFDL